MMLFASDGQAIALMTQAGIVDTFPAFLEFWTRVQHDPLAVQIERWASEYIARWPELLAKQLADYASQNVDWQQVAREKVFPCGYFLGEEAVKVLEARMSLREIALSGDPERYLCPVLEQFVEAERA